MFMSTYIKNVELGNGRTKICLPIIARTKETILSEAEELKNSVADIIEWRVDFYEDIMCIEKTLETLTCLADVLEDKPVLFTFRTKDEGGEREVETDYYKHLIIEVIKQRKAGAVDVELFKEEGLLEEISGIADEYDMIVIASNHDFEKTPSKDIIVERLLCMKAKGAHISKIAVMPKNEKDVLSLLQATYEAKQALPEMTIITMSMGKLGVISRLGGGVFGSAMTFGAKTKELASAPGQVEAEQLKDILAIIEE